MSSSRSLAAARAKRAGENAPPVSGGRPVTSIGSQAAFAQQMPSGMGYNIPPPPSNVRTARAIQPQPPRFQPPHSSPQQQYYEQQQQQQSANGLPFNKLSVSDAIGLITLRLGRVEQWIIETDHEDETKGHSDSHTTDIPENHRVIDNSVLASIISRLDSLEKNGLSQPNATGSGEVMEEIKSLKEQFKNVSDIVTKHTLELAKNTEQVFRFNRELTETKDILKSFMVKYDMFAQETSKSFADYEAVFADYDVTLEKIERRLPLMATDEQVDTELEGTSVDTNATDGENIIMTVDLKNMIKQELSSSL